MIVFVFHVRLLQFSLKGRLFDGYFLKYLEFQLLWGSLGLDLSSVQINLSSSHVPGSSIRPNFRLIGVVLVHSQNTRPIYLL